MPIWEGEYINAHASFYPLYREAALFLFFCVHLWQQHWVKKESEMHGTGGGEYEVQIYRDEVA